MPGLLLAIESSGSASTLALGGDDGVTLIERAFAGERGRALVPELDALLREEGRSIEELTGIVVGTGPGSYTGLRIACTAARVLAYARGLPAGGVCSFAAAALAAPLDRDTHVLLDAYRGEVYHAAYRREAAGLRELVAPRVLPRDDAAGAIPAGALLLGEPALGPPRVESLASELQPRASRLIVLCAQQGGVARLAAAEPLYLRAAAVTRSRRTP